MGYTLLAEATAARAAGGGVGGLGCIAIWLGRRGVAFNSLFAAALVVLAINPNDLFRAGPQLSFLAVAVLIWFGHWAWCHLANAGSVGPDSESVQPWYERTLKRAEAVDIVLLVTSLAVWLTTLPLVLSTFHVVSPIAIPASLIVWPLVIVAMWSGFFMLVVGWIGRRRSAHYAPSSATGRWLVWKSVVQWAAAVPAGHSWASRAGLVVGRCFLRRPACCR